MDNENISKLNKLSPDKIGLVVTLGGLLIGILIGFLTDSFTGAIIVAGFQISGFILGVIHRKTVCGKAAYITSAIILICVLLMTS